MEGPENPKPIETKGLQRPGTPKPFETKGLERPGNPKPFETKGLERPVPAAAAADDWTLDNMISEILRLKIVENVRKRLCVDELQLQRRTNGVWK